MRESPTIEMLKKAYESGYRDGQNSEITHTYECASADKCDEVKKAYQQGRTDAINQCIATIKEMHNMYDVMCGDWSNCYQIIDELKMIKEQK